MPQGSGPGSPCKRAALVGPPAVGRYLLRLGDLCVPSRRCAGGGLLPAEPAVLLTMVETLLPWVVPPAVGHYLL